MRTAALTLVTFVALGYAANAQKFSLLPQVGFENSKTTIRYNGLSSFSPLGGVKFSPQISLRLNYESKQGHGLFLGVATSRSLVSFSFADPENGMNNYTATTSDMRLRLEGGYQFSSKPIYFNKNKTNQSSAAKPDQKNAGKKNCSSHTAGSQCAKNYTSSSRCSDNANKVKPQTQKSKGTWIRIQPSVGMAYIPTVKAGVVSKTQGSQTLYEYRAGNWNTALITGTGFEFGKNSTRQFTISINYIKGIGNLSTETISMASGIKTVTTTLQSAVSGWNMKAGIPFTLGTKKPATRTKTEKKTQQPKINCAQYRIYRCNKTN
jgi:hypothetical protein